MPTMIDYINAFIMPAAFSLLPGRMDSPEARAMLLAIGLQESRFGARVQFNGPALGFWQFERAGVKGVLTHAATKDVIAGLLPRLCYRAESPAHACHEAIEHNDILACVFARLLLWTLPDALPGPQAHAAAWSQYIRAWKPGKAHRATWDACYTGAWTRVGPTS